MKRFVIINLIILIISLLSGCLYPKEKTAQQIPTENYIAQVQDAVNRYREDNNGLLPLKNKEDDTDVYLKYLIDFNKLVPRYLGEIPANAFEVGGVFQYVLVEPETNPTVKIFDLQIADQIREIKLRLSTQKYPPIKDIITDHVFSLDFSEIGYEDPPVIISPYTGQNLPFIISSEGEIYVDYGIDLYQKLQELGIDSVPYNQDIREILVEDSIFVPAYSLPYTIDEFGAPIFMINNS